MDNNMYYQNYRDEEIDLGEMFKYIWKHALVVLIIGVLCALLGAGYSYKKNQNTRSYQSTTSVYFDPVFEIENAAANVSVQEAIVKDYAEIAKSKAVIEAAIDRLGINSSYEEVCDYVSSDVNSSRVLEITVAHDDPVLAQQLADGIAEETVEYVKEYSKYSDPAILERASMSVPSGAAKKNLIKFVLIGFIAGLIIGCVLYAIIYICSDKILCDYDIKRFLQLNTLAVIAKGDSAESVISRIQKEIEFVPVEINTENTDLDDYLKALQLAKENTDVVVVVKRGTHAKQAQKTLDKINLAGSKIIGAILVEA